MRTILSVLAFFSLWGPLRAQTGTPSCARELPRSPLIVGATCQEAARAADGNRYVVRPGAWTRDGNVLSVPFTVPFAWINRQVFVRIPHASSDYAVRVNGRTVGSAFDNSTAAEFNVTKFVNEGRNTLELVLSEPSGSAPLESWRPEQAAPAAGEAIVLSQPTMHVRDIAVKTWRADGEDETATAEIALIVKSDALNPRTSRIYYELLAPDGSTAASGYDDMTLDMRREDTLRFVVRIPDTLQWSAERPVLHTLRVRTQHDGRYVETIEEPVGFRSVEMRGERMFVNGQPAALNVREVRPDITDEEIAALRGKGVNTLLPLPGTIGEPLYEACDRSGMYVIVQAPVDTRRSGPSRRKEGNPANDPSWQEAFAERTADAYHVAKRHPSVIAFSLARQSSNGICLYESYLRMKETGDPRPFVYPEAAGEWNSDPLAY